MRKEQLALVVSIDGSGELNERMENLWKKPENVSMSYLPLVFSRRKADTAPN